MGCAYFIDRALIMPTGHHNSWNSRWPRRTITSAWASMNARASRNHAYSMLENNHVHLTLLCSCPYRPIDLSIDRWSHVDRARKSGKRTKSFASSTTPTSARPLATERSRRISPTSKNIIQSSSESEASLLAHDRSARCKGTAY